MPSPSHPTPPAGSQPTGNPVFDYRAEFRTRALTLQRLLIKGGLLLALVGGAAWLFGRTGERLRLISAAGAGVGVIFFIAGIAWGFFWRKHLRAQFQRTHGL